MARVSRPLRARQILRVAALDPRPKWSLPITEEDCALARRWLSSIMTPDHEEDPNEDKWPPNWESNNRSLGPALVAFRTWDKELAQVEKLAENKGDGGNVVDQDANHQHVHTHGDVPPLADVHDRTGAHADDPIHVEAVAHTESPAHNDTPTHPTLPVNTFSFTNIHSHTNVNADSASGPSFQTSVAPTVLRQDKGKVVQRPASRDSEKDGIEHAHSQQQQQQQQQEELEQTQAGSATEKAASTVSDARKKKEELKKAKRLLWHWLRDMEVVDE